MVVGGRGVGWGVGGVNHGESDLGLLNWIVLQSESGAVGRNLALKILRGVPLASKITKGENIPSRTQRNNLKANPAPPRLPSPYK